MELLRCRGFAFTTTAEREVVRDIKEKLGFVSQNFRCQLQHEADSKAQYQLPDGQTINVLDEAFRCTEILFDPTLCGLSCPGIPTMIQQTVEHCDAEIQQRLTERVILSGGTSCFRGLPERLEGEMIECWPSGTKKVQISSNAIAKYSAWIGGSMLSSLSSSKSGCISKQEYDEDGPSVVVRKCL
jgi:actin